MSDALPIYVLAFPGPSRDRLLGLLGGDGSALDPGSFVGSWDMLAPGLLLADADGIEVAQLLSVARPITAAAYGWILALVGDGESPTVRVLSLAPGVPLDDVIAFARDPERVPEAVLELQRVLARVSRARHDLNNPLTSALAEVQLLLMDAEDGEAREALEVVQTQLRRIRDLIAETGHLKPRKP